MTEHFVFIAGAYLATGVLLTGILAQSYVRWRKRGRPDA